MTWVAGRIFFFILYRPFFMSANVQFIVKMLIVGTEGLTKVWKCSEEMRVL